MTPGELLLCLLFGLCLGAVVLGIWAYFADPDDE